MDNPIPVQFHPEAVEEAWAARAWYEARSESAALGFLRELDQALVAISEFPTRRPEHIGGTRRFVMRRYPYIVVYRIVADGIQVVAVAHGRRRPGYWRSRAEDSAT